MQRFIKSVALALALASFGCGNKESDRPKTGFVTGVVRMDGQPLPNVHVVFAPVQGRSSTSTTNGNGEYDLIYLPNVRGAVLGTHEVSIRARSEDDETPGKETIPAKYNSKTTLTAEVKEGKNTFDFDLQSK